MEHPPSSPRKPARRSASSGGARWAAVVMVLMAGALSAAPEGGLAERLAAREAALVTELEAVAAWCGNAKLNRQQARVADVILTYRPDHEDARRWDGYA